MFHKGNEQRCSVAQDESKHLNGTRANRHTDADVLRSGSVLQRREC
jgi:hypothetical protein